MKTANSLITLLPVDRELAATFLVPAMVFFVIGVACVVAPGGLIKLQVRMLEWQRRVFGAFGVDWHLGLVRHPAAPWIVRAMGLFFAAVGLFILASAVAGLSAPATTGAH